MQTLYKFINLCKYCPYQIVGLLRQNKFLKKESFPLKSFKWVPDNKKFPSKSRAQGNPFRILTSDWQLFILVAFDHTVPFVNVCIPYNACRWIGIIFGAQKRFLLSCYPLFPLSFWASGFRHSNKGNCPSNESWYSSCSSPYKLRKRLQRLIWWKSKSACYHYQRWNSPWMNRCLLYLQRKYLSIFCIP